MSSDNPDLIVETDDLTWSPAINEFAAALADAQKVMKGAKKDSANPFFKSSYADLASVADACMEPLNTNGIAVIQAPAASSGGRVRVTTALVHKSGQWMKGTLSCAPKDDGPQAVGSVITYLRRYSLASFAGVAPEDDDAEAGEGRKDGKAASGEVMRVEAPKGAKGPLTITSVVKKETKRKNFFRFEVAFSDGRKASFVNNDQMSALCESLAQNGSEVDVVIERGDYGPELKEVVAVKQIQSVTASAPPAATNGSGQTMPF